METVFIFSERTLVCFDAFTGMWGTDRRGARTVAERDMKEMGAREGGGGGEILAKWEAVAELFLSCIMFLLL